MNDRTSDELPLNVELRDGRRAIISQSVEDNAESLLAFLDVAGAETDFLSFSTAREIGSVETERAFGRAQRATDDEARRDPGQAARGALRLTLLREYERDVVQVHRPQFLSAHAA
jgi:hypothetical protein